MAATTTQSSSRPPAQPSYIFRGHSAAIHSVQIIRQNRRLLTGDADGWVVSWNLESKRPVAVWRAHEATILGAEEWSTDKIITHGRDSALRIWQLGDGDEAHLSKVLPADGSGIHRPKPWLLHTLPVNTLNFCAFSMCREHRDSTQQQTASHAGVADSILVAVPARDDKKIEVYRFPEEKLVYVVPQVQPTDTGMTMAVKLTYHRPSNKLLLIAGYEGGFTAVHLLGTSSQYSSEATTDPALQLAQTIYLSQPHTQPILSLDALPDAKVYFTSSADAVIAAHRIPELPVDIGYASASSGEGISELESSSIGPSRPEHVSAGPAAEDNPRISTTKDEDSQSLFQAESLSGLQAEPSKPSGLSSLLAKAAPQPNVNPKPPPPQQLTIQPPFQTTQTKHSGQQSLRVRSDGRLLVTGGWDSRIRIYSTKTLKEVAVLKWHNDGVYAAGFSEILDSTDERLSGLSRLQKQREVRIQNKHWVVAGARDGKVSLWEVF
ncbi:WD40 repeat-like protein [Westerdykella ornata]|uniref:ASTRA-associated protein 1 n=1 Tax=Westerdykella ornata TaxID=318751 RepID=A0A6A6JHX5_WESOR|nr:WD40 repeat-like protein [Westerdykella ornata]KAF2275558.1 WD40 repeat-like protein [Westerdykella ornata]